MKLTQSKIQPAGGYSANNAKRFRVVVLVLVLVCACFVPLTFAKNTSESKAFLAKKKALHDSVKRHFDNKVTDLDATLFNNQQRLVADNAALSRFVDEKLLPLWSSTKTLKLMVGKKLWKTFSQGQIAQLEERFKQTFHRYVEEGMKHYDGQRIKVLSIRLHKKLRSGFLTAELEPIYLPKFNIMFKITKTQDQWKFYDILIEGIGYIKIKRTEYRQILHDKGFDALICYLDQKNLGNEIQDNKNKNKLDLATRCKNAKAKAQS